jgi:TrmH family RNA methyltransferase
MSMITSSSNPKVKWVRNLQANRRERWRKKQFVMEGVRLAQEVIDAGIKTELVFHTDQLNARGRGQVNQLARLGAEVHLVSDSVMATCSDTENPPGLLLVVPFQELPVPANMTLSLVVDRIADPGNLGTMIRTAWAAGAEALFLTKGCVDPYNPKVVRAAAGAHLRLPILQDTPEKILERLSGMEIWLAEKGEGSAYSEVDWQGPSAVIIGSEAHGVRDELRSRVDKRVHIPLHEEVESLNAAIAAGIILFEIVRQREATWKSVH